MTMTEFWAKAKQILAEKVPASDFGFLDGILIPSHLGPMKEVLVFAEKQEALPDLPDLSTFFRARGYKHWMLTDLKDKGLITNPKPGRGKWHKGIWRLTPLLFKNLLEVPENVNGNEGGSAKPPTGSKVPSKFRGKSQQIWNFLQQERVGDRLLVTRELIEKISEQVGTKPGYVVNMLYRFQKIGLLKGVSHDRGKPMEVSFQDNARKQKPAAAAKPQAVGILDAIGQEIATLENQKAKAVARIQEIDEQLAKKALVRDEIKRLSGITS